jgi:hypothetical protein
VAQVVDAQAGCQASQLDGRPEDALVQQVPAEWATLGSDEHEVVRLERTADLPSPLPQVSPELVAQRARQLHGAAHAVLDRAHLRSSGHDGERLGDLDGTPDQVQARDPKPAELTRPQSGGGSEPDQYVVRRPGCLGQCLHLAGGEEERFFRLGARDPDASHGLARMAPDDLAVSSTWRSTRRIFWSVLGASPAARSSAMKRWTST